MLIPQQLAKLAHPLVTIAQETQLSAKYAQEDFKQAQMENVWDAKHHA
jgi:hypothetical protein